MESVIVETTYAAMQAHRAGHKAGFKAGVTFSVVALLAVKLVKKPRKPSWFENKMKYTNAKCK